MKMMRIQPEKGSVLIPLFGVLFLSVAALAGGVFIRGQVEKVNESDNVRVGYEPISPTQLVKELIPRVGAPKKIVSELTQCALKSGQGYCFMSQAKGAEVCVSFESNCLQLRAQESRDISDCNRIDGEENIDLTFKASCYGHIAGFRKNIDLCDEFTEKDPCYLSYSSETNDSSVCKLIIDKFSRDSCYGSIAAEKNDRSMCDLIESSSFRASCIGVVASQASTSVDSRNEFASWKTVWSISEVGIPAKIQYPPGWAILGIGSNSFADGLSRSWLLNFSPNDYMRDPLRPEDYIIEIANFGKMLGGGKENIEVRTLAELKEKIWEGGTGDKLVDFSGNVMIVLNQKEYSINGFPAFDLEVRGEGMVETDKSTYILDGNGNSVVFGQRGNTDVGQAYFNKILSTFTFLK